MSEPSDTVHMPIDELAEGVIRVFGRLLLEILVEVFFEVWCYWLGLGTLRAFSLGQYPPSTVSPRQQTLCKVLGFFEFIGAAVLAVIQLT